MGREKSPNQSKSSPSRYPPLSPGRQMLPREFIERYQRSRLVVALAEVAHERGVGRVTTSLIVKQAGVSRRTFYQLFEDKDDCIAFACEEARRQLFDPVEDASIAPGPWLDRLDGAVGALLEATAADPLIAELYLVHSLAIAGKEGGASYQTGIETMAKALRDGRESAAKNDRPDPPVGVEEFIAGAIVSALSMRLRRGEAANLPKLRGELVRLATVPFLGLEEATRHSQALEAA